VILFAFSTMIFWSDYGEQSWVQLFGVRSIGAYKLLFLVACWAGAVFQAQAVLDFGDLMILGMALPNITGLLMLSGTVKADLDVYLAKLASGQFPRA
jgi:AGCS family alanine or glycine:cation symporter